MAQTQRLGDLLVEAGAITQEQLSNALAEQKKSGQRLGAFLVSKGWITESKLMEALSLLLKFPLVSLSRYRPSPEALRKIPQNVALRLQVIPLNIEEDGSLRIATADPLDIMALDELRMLTGMEIHPSLATPSDISRNIERLYTIQDSVKDAMVEIVEGGQRAREFDLARSVSEAAPDDAPVIQLVNSVIEQAVREGASDIHIEPFEKVSHVRYRVDGQLFNAFDFPFGLHPAVSSRIKIMSGMNISEKRRPQDGRIVVNAMNRRIDLRVSSLPSIYGEKMVIRILDQGNAQVGLQKLGFEDDDRELIDLLISQPYGIILLTGPTGSGKSTTLYSMLEQINKPEVNVVTVEDPVEYTILGVTQVQVNEKAGLTFESTLRSILRQDPDKIMIGEIRDRETAQLAIRAALTGHLVLSTLHTNDAPSAAVRLTDMGIAPFLVSSSLMGIIAQRLVRVLCPYCKERYTLADNMCHSLGTPEGTPAWKPVGCNECRGTGYKGRAGIFEILVVNDTIRRMIVANASTTDLREEAIKLGMKTLRTSGVHKVLAGVTSVEEVFEVSM